MRPRREVVQSRYPDAAVVGVRVALAKTKGDSCRENFLDQGGLNGSVEIEVVVVAIGRAQVRAKLAAWLARVDLDGSCRSIASKNAALVWRIRPVIPTIKSPSRRGELDISWMKSSIP